MVAASEGPEAEKREAMNRLLGAYWYPLYAHVRRRGYSAETAHDLTQAFLERMLERQWLGRADANRGRFRAFLLASLDHFLANERVGRRTLKRGGKVHFVSLPMDEAELRWRRDSSRDLTPERAYDLHWVLNLLEAVLRRIRAELASNGREREFELLKPYLTGGNPPRYAELTVALSLTEAAARMAVYRLRQRYRLLVREEIARTLADPGLVEDELQSLLTVLRTAT